MRARTHRHARLRRPVGAGRRCALALSCLALAGLASAGSGSAAAFRFGLSDYEPSTFSDPRVRELGIHLARDVVPWNAVLKPRELVHVTDWLRAVRRAYHVTPFITFEHASNNNRGPSPAQYLSAFLRFRKLFPWVKEFSPWNEATHATQPTQRHPKLAAEYYNVLVAHCPGCEIAAPDTLDADGNVEAWIETFLQTAHPRPTIWPFNPYSSTSTGNPTLIESFLAAVPGQVWFSEVGGVVWWRFKGKLIDHGEAYAARVARNIFQLARLSPRITRVYYYHWRSPGNPKRGARKATWDAGLVRSGGGARPALLVIARELHRSIQKSIPKLF
ncbi:MAG TPA: hypothetical protein VFV03_07720 [Solirubrobacteraceae bacterium]|nr:hypothetical protein [Solirubrobacteraceae bacterium]